MSMYLQAKSFIYLNIHATICGKLRTGIRRTKGRKHPKITVHTKKVDDTKRNK